jgi:hypothetical protein
MKSIYIAGGKASNTAVNIMKGHLEGLGHRVTRDARDANEWDVTLRWGISYHGNKPAINAGVNQFDKLDCFVAFDKLKVKHPHIIGMNEDEYDVGEAALLARKRHHVKGKDIVVCLTLEDIERVQLQGEHDFFSVFIPTQTEYRVWVFQDKAFGIYEKQFKGEGEYEGYMRNRRFGFKFEKRDNLRGMKEIEEPSIKAVAALRMDFGAVDVLLGKDGKFYVLEVNSMPHIDSNKRSSGIRLANLFSDWAEDQ